MGGAVHDRDIKSANNLKKVAESLAGGCQSFQRQSDCLATACGKEGDGFGHKFKTKPVSVKQGVSFVSVRTGMSKFDGTEVNTDEKILTNRTKSTIFEKLTVKLLGNFYTARLVMSYL